MQPYTKRYEKEPKEHHYTATLRYPFLSYVLILFLVINNVKHLSLIGYCRQLTF